MTIWLEQLFFGRGPQGYAVLGMTQGGGAFAAAVQSLCESVGAPSDASTFQPFLLSVPCRDRVVMVKTCLGAPDPIGRDTVFFHALVGSVRDLVATHVDAFVLDERGLFVDRMPSRVERLEISPDAVPLRVPEPSFKVSYPAAICSARPDKELVRTLLGSPVLGRRWASFAFHPMPGFDLYVLDTRAPRPSDVACYDSTGVLLSEPRKTHTDPGGMTPAVKTERRGRMLKISLVVNLALLVLCAYFVAGKLLSESSNISAQERSMEGLTRENARISSENARLKEETKRLKDELRESRKSAESGMKKEEVVRQLKSEFEVKYNGKMTDESRVKDVGKEYQEAFGPYVRFVNRAILEPSKDKQ